MGPLVSLVFLIFFVYMISGVRWFFENDVKIPNNGALLGSVSGVVALQNEGVAPAENPVSAPAEPQINAASAISVESDLKGLNEVIFIKSGRAQLPIASLTKLMTAVVVLDNYNLSDIISVDQAADSQSPLKQDVKLGDSLPVESFLEIMLVESSNKSAYALSESIGEEKFVALMNQKAKNLGMENTFFADPTGLSSDDVSTASDLAKLAEYILARYPKIAEISSRKELDVLGFGSVTNTDQLLGEVPEVVCGKTGFTTQAKGCLLLVTKNPKDNDYLINLVLGADDRFAEMQKLISWSNLICN